MKVLSVFASAREHAQAAVKEGDAGDLPSGGRSSPQGVSFSASLSGLFLPLGRQSASSQKKSQQASGTASPLPKTKSLRNLASGEYCADSFLRWSKLCNLSNTDHPVLMGHSYYMDHKECLCHTQARTSPCTSAYAYMHMHARSTTQHPESFAECGHLTMSRSLSDICISLSAWSK